MVPRRRLVAASFALPLAARAAQAAPPVAAQAAPPVAAQAAPPLAARLREETRPAAALAFTDAEGREHALADFAGRGLVINFWATWCPPCVAEMPALDRLAAALAGDGILVLPLSSDRGGAGAVRPFYERVGVRHLGVWLDPRGAAQRAAGARALPTTVIVDRAGQERARAVGEAAWDAPEAIETVRRLVG